MLDKRCYTCKEVKPVASFSKCSREKDGLNGRCKACVKVNINRVKAAEKYVPAEKACTCCKKVKCSSEFYPSRVTSTGISSECKDCSVRRASMYQAANKHQCNARKFKWSAANPEKRAKASSEFTARNKPYYAAATSKYRYTKSNAAPPWLTECDLWMIQEAYDLAKLREHMLGGKWEVDHIVPIQGKTVSGLHVPWNLQVIPMNVNRRKSNKLEVESRGYSRA